MKVRRGWLLLLQRGLDVEIKVEKGFIFEKEGITKGLAGGLV